jgi:hypothetical protein
MRSNGGVKPRQVCLSSSLPGNFLLIWSNQVKLVITKNSFCIEQRAKALSKTGIFLIMFYVKLLRIFKPAGLNVRISLFLCFIQLLIWNFQVRFCTHGGAVPYRSSAQMSCRLMTQTTHITLWEIKYTHVFLSADSISSRSYRFHCALSLMRRAPIKGKCPRRTKWSISSQVKLLITNNAFCIV